MGPRLHRCLHNHDVLFSLRVPEAHSVRSRSRIPRLWPRAPSHLFISRRPRSHSCLRKDPDFFSNVAKTPWWRHHMQTFFPRYWPFVRGIHRSPVNSSQKGQWRGALMFSLICAWINVWVNNREAGDLRRHHAHCDVIVMQPLVKKWNEILGFRPLLYQVWLNTIKNGWPRVNDKWHLNI